MYQLSQAEDSGNPVRYDTASVSIYIEDVNDSPPLFLHSPYIAHVVENAADLPRQASLCLPFCRLFISIAQTLPRTFPDDNLFCQPDGPASYRYYLSPKTACSLLMIFRGHMGTTETKLLFCRFVMKITAEDRDSSPYNNMKYSLKVRIYF
jgi:hypothetical protein